jgi:hypothetical protein
MALRLALGAGRGRLFRQLLTESLLLAALGGAIGLALAVWGVQVLTHILPSDIPRLGQVTLDGTVLAFTFGLVLVTGLLFSLAPGIQASRAGLSGVMKEGGARGSTGSAPLRLRSALVVLEVVLTMLLLVGAGLLARSFWRLQSVELGFEPAGLLTFELGLPEARYPEAGQAARLYQSILEGAGALPEIESAAEATQLPLGDQGFSISVFVEGRPRPEPDQIPVTFYRAASNDYFQDPRNTPPRGPWIHGFGPVGCATHRRHQSGHGPEDLARGRRAREAVHSGRRRDGAGGDRGHRW